jgi:hypothetical protein
MVLDHKHFDDIEDFCDFDDKLDTSSELEMGENAPNHLSWRRILIERAANNVKKAFENKTDLTAAYKRGSLVFDGEASKFGRVIESKPGFLNLSLVAGGELIRGNISQLDFIRENHQKLTLPEIANKLSISEIEVMGFLNQLELETDKQLKPTLTKQIEAKNLNKKALLKTKKRVKGKKTMPEIDVISAKQALKLPTLKPAIKIAAKKKDNKVKKKIASSKETPINFTRLLPKGATTDPIVDPNGYIQQNFLLMSNRELAGATGLSEHTIRRKLGEWNLKRRDFVNKA